jgi:prepilin-type N-terminal cleavage/methylation domain-containing protein
LLPFANGQKSKNPHEYWIFAKACIFPGEEAMHERRLGSRSGHTLIELLTVLAIIALLVTAAVTSMTAYMERNRTRGALDRITNDIAYARVMAVRSGSRVTIDFTGVAAYEIIEVGPPSRVLRAVALANDYPGVTIVPPTGDGRLEFDARGMLRSTPTGSIVARSGSGADSASITMTGRVYRAY